MNANSTARARRIARRHGLTLWKPREDSRQSWEYGPLALIDPTTTGIIARGLTTIEEVDEAARGFAGSPG